MLGVISSARTRDIRAFRRDEALILPANLDYSRVWQPFGRNPP